MSEGPGNSDESATGDKADSEDDDLPGIEQGDSKNAWTSDVALTLEQARALTSRRGATLVMFLGEVGTGKSTLLVETWTDFLLLGALGEVGFAGTATALAFEERAFDSRIESDGYTPETRRTQAENDGFLHLRISKSDGELVEVLLADVTGEHFTRVREGTGIEEELPWVRRVDRFCVVVDGDGFSRGESRETTVTRTQRLLHALANARSIPPTSRIALVLTKQDIMTENDLARYDSVEGDLLQLASLTDPSPVAIRTAARPGDASDPQGLEDLVGWICADDRPFPVARSDPPESSRAMSRFRT